MLATLLLTLSLALAADPAKAHPHKGVVAAYTNGPPTIPLSAQEQATLASGKPVLKQIPSATGGRGVAVFDVNASRDKVWSVITNYGMYPSWVDNVETCATYKRDGNSVYVDFVLDPVGMTVEYYIKHTFNPQAYWITWTLDYSRASDLDDSVGFWKLTEVSPGRTRVEYSAAISITGWVPGFVKTMIEDKGLQNATSWVKVQSEKK